MKQHHSHNTKVSFAGLLITLGIIYGDIGTSPLYVFKAIVGEHPITEQLVLGGLSCIIWTLTFSTTIKYITLALEADNRGEGGVFALYALVRRRAKWLIFPAIIGGSALLADGIITPPISVSSAIEGLRILDPEIKTLPIVISILIALFSVQHFGTKVVGKSFGPIMLVWFLMLATLGIMNFISQPVVFKAINPLYALDLLYNFPNGFWLLGAVFLCTTGAEAMYSDLGHCGKLNIRASWGFVKSALLMNYAGQAAWLLNHNGELLNGRNPFYALMPESFLLTGIGIATVATIIASQAIISGAYTVVTEAMRLYLFPKLKIVYPTEMRGQIYVPDINRLLLLGCLGVTLYFQESSNMEAAYGLAIAFDMLMTSILLSYFIARRFPGPLFAIFLAFYVPLEASFIIANAVKFAHGGWVTFFVGGCLFTVMWTWYNGSMLKRRYTEYEDLVSRLPLLDRLSTDTSVAKYATHLVYMTGSGDPAKIEKKVMYSLLQKSPKRADVYWFLHVDVVDEPYAGEYKVTALIPGRVFRIDFRLGFRVEPRINMLFRQVITDLAENKEVDVYSRYESLRDQQIPGDFRFVVLHKILSYENELPTYERMIMNSYSLLKRHSLSEEESFGLDTSSVVTETVPLIISPGKKFELARIA
jgi:KUP system potassium uptake protein